MKIIVNNRYNIKIWKLYKYLNKQRQATVQGQKNHHDLTQLINFLKHNWKNRRRKDYSETKDVIKALGQGLFLEEPIFIIASGDEKDIYGKSLHIRDWKKHLMKLKFKEGFNFIKISYLSSHLLSPDTIEKLQQIDNELSQWKQRDYIIFKLKYLWTIVFPNNNLDEHQIANLVPISAEEIAISDQNFRQKDFLYPVSSRKHFELLVHYNIDQDFLLDSEKHHDPKWFINEVATLHNSRKNFEKKHKAYMPTPGAIIVHIESFIIFEHKLHYVKNTTLYPSRVYKYDQNNVWSYKEVKSYIVNNPSYHGDWQEAFKTNINVYDFHKSFMFEDEIKQLQDISLINQEEDYDEFHEQLTNLYIQLIINDLNKMFKPIFYFKKDVFGKRITFKKRRKEYVIKLVTDFSGADFLYRNHSQNINYQKTEYAFYCKTIWPIYETMQIFKNFCIKIIKNI